MKADGSIIIDTKILDGGMEKGFELIKDEMASVGITARKVGEQIEMTFSNIDVSKPIANAANQVRSLEAQLANVTADLKEALLRDDDSAAQRLGTRQIQLYDRLEQARERLAWAVSDAADKQADAEERAAQREAKAAQKTANAKAKAQEKELKAMAKPVRRFGVRLREVATGALVFNVISAGLRGMVNYFGKALMANDEFSASLKRLKGSLATAFQPILETITPALIQLINWVNVAVQALGRLFATLSGRSYSDMKKNAQALNNQTNAIDKTGQAAKDAQKYLAGFDEINKALGKDSASSSGANDDGGATFEDFEIPSEMESAIDSFAMRIKDIFFEWDNLTGEQIAQKLLTALTVVAGGLIGFALGGPKGALIGMTIGAGLGVVLSNIIFDGDGNLSTEELLRSLFSILAILGGGIIGFAIGGVPGAAIGATIGIALSFLIQNLSFDSIVEGWNELKKQLGLCYKATVEQTDKEFNQPTKNLFKNLTKDISQESDSWFQRIISNWELTARTTDSGYIMPTYQQFSDLGSWIKSKMTDASARVTANWEQSARTTEAGYIIPTREQFANMLDFIVEKFKRGNENIRDIFRSLPGWFQDTILGPISNFFDGRVSSVVNGFNNIARSIASALSDLAYWFTEVISLSERATRRSSRSSSSSSSSSGYAASYYAAPEIPQLAKGAVIPPNHKFLAVLGDQNRGTNIEAPLATIQEAVAVVMEDLIESNLAGHEATVAVLQQILEAVLGIELDGEMLSHAVNSYNKKMAMVRGG